MRCRLLAHRQGYSRREFQASSLPKRIWRWKGNRVQIPDSPAAVFHRWWFDAIAKPTPGVKRELGGRESDRRWWVRRPAARDELPKSLRGRAAACDTYPWLAPGRSGIVIVIMELMEWSKCQFSVALRWLGSVWILRYGERVSFVPSGVLHPCRKHQHRKKEIYKVQISILTTIWWQENYSISERCWRCCSWN